AAVPRGPRRSATDHGSRRVADCGAAGNARMGAHDPARVGPAPCADAPRDTGTATGPLASALTRTSNLEPRISDLDPISHLAPRTSRVLYPSSIPQEVYARTLYARTLDGRP